MNQAEIKRTQRRIGVVDDGFWGPKSTEAAKQHLRKLVPHSSPFPSSRRVGEFYGEHGSETFSPPRKRISLPFAIYYGGKPVTYLDPHEKCADSLLAVFHRLASVFPDSDSRKRAGILTYDGLYNPRRMRGGSSWSMHAWAIAIDFDAGRNGNNTHWPTAAIMPIEVMECFACEGWTSAGAFWSRDAMHFEAVAP